ncbi:MAG: response regulator [Thermodesulfobacteriota bacterium]|nr:response regulator [Thermodesulfobacteriota bacterium]
MAEEQLSDQKKQILFVDDEESLALLGADLLEDFGYKVTCAFAGDAALQLFQQQANTFDLIITDESMPGMNGIELAQQIFMISPSTPVILCSGHLLTMQEEGMDRANITAVLAKTSVCSELPGMIEKIFSA